MSSEIVRELVGGEWVTKVGSGGSQSVLMATANLSAAQLLALDVTAVELLPAPGGRLYYVVHGVELHYRFVMTPYDPATMFDGGLLLGYGSVVADLTGPGGIYDPLGSRESDDFQADAFFVQTEDAYVQAPFPAGVAPVYGWTAWLASAIEDKAVIIGLGGGSTLVGGDGTLTVRTFYSLIDGAP